MNNFRSIKQLFGSWCRPQDVNRVTSVFDLQIYQVSEKASRRSRRLLEASSGGSGGNGGGVGVGGGGGSSGTLAYVRGEENLKGWRPRSDSLIVEHQWELERLVRLELVEKARHTLQLREKLAEAGRVDALSAMDAEAAAAAAAASAATTSASGDDISSSGVSVGGGGGDGVGSASGLARSPSYSVLDDIPNEVKQNFSREQLLIRKCLQLLSSGRTQLLPSASTPITSQPQQQQLQLQPSQQPMPQPPAQLSQPQAPPPRAALPSAISYASGMSDMWRPQMRHSPSASFASLGGLQMQKSPTMESMMSSASGGGGIGEPLDSLRPGSLVGQCDEIRASPQISRRGYLNFLEEKSGGWVRRWVVVRRPFLYFYQHERDPVERGFINLATAQIEYSEEQQAMLRAKNAFTVITPHRGYLMQCLEDKEVHDWLYAFNPLMAGQMRSKLGRKKKDRQ